MAGKSNDTANRALERNLGVTTALAFCHGFMIIMPVAVPLFQSKGLGMAEVFQLQSIFALVVVALEVPSGYLADWFGRRPTLLLGGLFTGLGFSALWFADDFAGLVVFECTLGVGVSLISGADVAMLYDSAKALLRGEVEQQRLLGRFQAARAWAEGLAALACGVLFAELERVVAVQIAAGWLPLVCALLLVEPPRHADGDGARQGPEFAAVYRHLAGSGRVLLLTFLALSFWGLSTFYGTWLLQKHWQLGGIGLAWFGYLWALNNFVLALGGRYASALERRFGPWNVLVISAALPVAGYLGLAYGAALGGVLFGVTFFAARGVAFVVLRHAFNARLPGSFRATANSLASFLFRGAFMVTGPLVGWVFDLWGMQFTLLLCAAGALALLVSLILPLVVAIRESEVSNVVVQGQG